MRPLPAVVLLIVVVTAGCARSDHTAPESMDSGVRGVVLLGPSCPVETGASRCPGKPWVGKVRATRGADYVEAGTDDRGRFTMSLEAGTWTVTPLVDHPGPPSASPLDVRVEPHLFTTVTLTVDTGIR